MNNHNWYMKYPKTLSDFISVSAILKMNDIELKEASFDNYYKYLTMNSSGELVRRTVEMDLKGKVELDLFNVIQKLT